MGDDRKPRGLTPEQWAEARRAYEAGESVLSISKRLNARRQTIMACAQRECWTAQPTAQVSGPEIHRAATRKVIDMASRRVVEGLVQTGELQHIVVTARANLERMASIEAGLLDVAELTIKRLRGDEGTIPLRQSAIASEAADIKAAIEAIGKTVDMYAKLHGLGAGDAILASEEVDDKEWTIESYVVGEDEVATA